MVSSVVFKMKPRVFLFSLQILLPFQTHGNDGRTRKIIVGVHPANRGGFSRTVPAGQERGFTPVNELIRLTPVDAPGKVGGEE